MAPTLSWEKATSDDYILNGYDVVGYSYFGGVAYGWLELGRTSDTGWGPAFLGSNKCDTAPTLNLNLYDNMAERPLWMDNAVIAGLEYLGGVPCTPTNNHIDDDVLESVGENISYADGHVDWLDDPGSLPAQYSGNTGGTINW
jgi:hypothetical protein